MSSEIELTAKLAKTADRSTVVSNRGVVKERWQAKKHLLAVK